MSIKILTKNGIDNTNIDGARQNNFNAGGRSGIVLGALSGGDFISTASNVVALTACELIMSGHRIVIDEAVYFTLSNIPSEPTRYSLVAELIVDSEKVPAFELKIQAAETPLVQENLHADGSGRYEIEIGRFTLTAQGITDLTQTAYKIQGGTGDDGTVLQQEAIDQLNSDVDILIEGIKKLADATVLVDEAGNPFEDENSRYFVPEYVDKWARAEILKLKEGN